MNAFPHEAAHQAKQSKDLQAILSGINDAIPLVCLWYVGVEANPILVGSDNGSDKDRIQKHNLGGDLNIDLCLC